jgi:excisionase family DNA binding protein
MDIDAKSGPSASARDPGQDHRRPGGHGELGMMERRLLSPEQAATYLGLRSRFAVYRLVSAGQLPALRLANKLRIDLRDLELLIEKAKADGVRPLPRSVVGAAVVTGRPAPPRATRTAPPVSDTTSDSLAWRGVTPRSDGMIRHTPTRTGLFVPCAPVA